MRRNWIAFPGLLLLSTSLVTSFPAAAQPTEKTAEEYIADGVAFHKQKNLEMAYSAYSKAWAIKKKKKVGDYALLANLGRVELERRMARDAAEHLACSLANWKSVMDDKSGGDRHKVEQRLTEAKKQVGTVLFHIVDDDGRAVEGAEIRVGNRPVDFCPAEVKEIYVEPQKRQLFSAVLPGCEDATWQAEVQKGATLDIPLTLKCRKDPPWGLIGGLGGVAVAGGLLGAGLWFRYTARDDSANALWRDLYTQGGQSACFGGANKAKCDDLVDADVDARVSQGVAIGSFAAGGAALVAASIILGLSCAENSTPKGSERRVQESSSLNISLGFDQSGGGAILKGSF